VAGEGPPLVLVHGLGASWRWWQPVLESLARQRRVFAFDLPGFGETRAKRWFSLKSAGEFVCQAMGALGLERADLVGHSMGGRICMDVAVSCPERVRRLVLVSTVGVPFGKTYPEVGLDLMRENRATPPEYLDLVMEDVRRVRPFELAWATLQVLMDDFRDRLSRIRSRTLVVWGERDLLTPLRLGRDLAAAIPGAKLAVFDQSGHNPMWDDPERFCQVTLGFLGSGSGAAERDGARVSAPGIAREREQPARPALALLETGGRREGQEMAERIA
jgi:pimeloyl-ACP methyl ester carboxylesterase